MSRFVRSTLSWTLLLSLGACSTPTMQQPDAAAPNDASDVDAGPFMPSWTNGPDFPYPIAFGAAVVLPGSDGFAYLYAVGGASGTFGALPPFHAEIQRARIQAGGLGPWEAAGSVSTGAMDFPLAGQGAIIVHAEDLTPGIAVGGGGGSGGYLGQVLAGYMQPTDGSLGMWGSFPPQVSAAQGGEVFGTFNSFESHQLALVGGLQGANATDHVIIAATMPGISVPTWRDGPALPAPRYGHGSVQVGVMEPDIFLIGGANSTGPLAEILVTVRDATTLEVTGWDNAGALSSPAVVFPQVSLIGTHVYVIGGAAGDPNFDPLETSVRMATAGTGLSGHGSLGTFTEIAAAALPEGRAGGLTATLGNTVYIIGGVMGAGRTASTSVIIGQLEP